MLTTISCVSTEGAQRGTKPSSRILNLFKHYLPWPNYIISIKIIEKALTSFDRKLPID
jgi:hypothetical protein